MYKVISYFTDLQDFNHPYKVGDKFPRLGLRVSDKRLEELASNKNRQGKPLIKKVEEPKQDDFSIDGKVVGKVKADVIEITDEEVIKENQFTKTEINRMPTADLKELAKVNGIDDSLSGAEIKKALIKRFGL